MLHEHVLYGYDYDDENNILIGRENISQYGVGSTITLMITSLMAVYRKFNRLPKAIDSSRIFKQVVGPDEDLYNLLFCIDESVDINFENMPVPFSPDDHHTIYQERYSNIYSSFFKRFFKFKPILSDRISELKQKYSIISDNSVSVIYRDSDKWTDMGGFMYLSAAAFSRIVDRIRDTDPSLSVIIQTENEGVRVYFTHKFRAISFTETPSAINTIEPPHITIKENKLDWFVSYLSALYIHSQSKYVVTYTGNSSFLVYLMRGSTKNLYQEKTFTAQWEDLFVNNN